MTSMNSDFSRPNPSCCIVWAIKDGWYKDAWDGLYTDPKRALFEASGGLRSGDYTRFLAPDPAEVVPWPFRDIVWATENGKFLLADGSWGNPGCDVCGELDAVVRVDGEYFCISSWIDSGVELNG